MSAGCTIVLAAVAARNGLRADGSWLFEGTPARVAEIARETGLHRGAVSRAIVELLQAGQLTQEPDGLLASAGAMSTRWADHRRRIRLDERVRSLGMRAEALLLAGLVLGQMDRSGRLILGRQWLAERLGWLVRSGKTTGRPARSLDVAIAAAERAGALHTWSIPGTWQFVLAPGPSQTRKREVPQTRNRESGGDGDGGDGGHPEPARCREPAKADVVNPQRECREPATVDVANPQKTSGVPSDPVSPPEPEAPAAPAGETVAALPGPNQQAPASPASLGTGDPAAIVERFVVAFARRGVERMGIQHAGDVAGLVDALSLPTPVRDRAALARERLRLCVRVVAWCPSPERLGRWLLRVRRRYGVQNLGAYLRRACEKGDAGTVLDNHHHVGRAVETWRDFSRATERALEGEHLVDVQQLVAGGAAVLAAVGPERDRLRAELRDYLAAGRRAAARTVLLQLVGNDRSDVALARAVGDVCTLAVAKELLAA